jgi:hypothetical protein
MIPEQRQKLIAALVALCEQYPHWRLAQLIMNVSSWADVHPWDVEDEQLLAAAIAHLNQISDRDDMSAPPAAVAGGADL